jgi:hypothetical protein
MLAEEPENASVPFFAAVELVFYVSEDGSQIAINQQCLIF